MKTDMLFQVGWRVFLLFIGASILGASSPNNLSGPDSIKSGESVQKKQGPLQILLDAGHGGKDLGAPGLYGIIEKELTLKISQLVKKSLERFGRLNDFPLDVRLSREEDVFLPLRERVRLANEWPADLFVSIHANSSDYPKARGFEVYFLNGSDQGDNASRIPRLPNHEKLTPGVLSILSDAETNLHVNESSKFAETVFQSMSLILRPNGRGVHQAPFTVLSGTQMPALLIEVGYVTQRQEAEKLTKAPYLKRVANAISSGIVDFAMHLRKVI